MTGPRRAIVLFAKRTVPGHVKTRLVPPLDDARAASLARAFLRDSAAKMVRVGARIGAAAVVCYAPADDEAWFRALLGDAVELVAQRDGDLTVRLSNAYRDIRELGYDVQCFIGADSPTLPDAYLESAFAVLRAPDRLALGPATDGGYYLIGLAAPHPEVFAGIAWSTPRVLSQTMAAARRLGLIPALLPPWYDVDDSPALQRLARDLAAGADAPFTRAALAAR